MSPATAAAPVVCLASASPRRRELLAQIGVAHLSVAAALDERPLAGEAPRDTVLRLARAKAQAVFQQQCALPEQSALPVLAADTEVVLAGRVFGKPRDRADGLAMLAALSGRTHQVLTAVALCTRAGLAEALSVSEVRFRAIGPDEREAYWDSGEPRDTAGGYAIQGRGAVFVERLEGSYSGVMGLPLAETATLLRAAGVPLWGRR